MTKRVRVAPPWVRGGKKPGSPEDRGSADRYYGRSYNPHYIKTVWDVITGRFLRSEKVTPAEGMTPEQVAEYDKGYDGETGEKVWFEPEPRVEEY